MDKARENTDIIQSIKLWFRADRLIQNIPFFLLVTLLGILYIANAHYHLQLDRKIDAKEAQLKQMGWEYMTLKSQVMYESKQSEVAKKVSAMGLKPLVEPPKIIEIAK